jgi:hypothetical protein
VPKAAGKAARFADYCLLDHLSLPEPARWAESSHRAVSPSSDQSAGICDKQTHVSTRIAKHLILPPISQDEAIGAWTATARIQFTDCPLSFRQ